MQRIITFGKWFSPGKVFVYSMLVGLLQLALAYFAGVFFDTFTINGEHIIRFGYLRTFHWSMVYLIVIPLILGSSLPVLGNLLDRSLKNPKYIPHFLALVSAGLAFATMTAGREGLYSWLSCSDNNTKFLQWNCFSDTRAAYAGSSYNRGLHILLFAISYIHYFMTYAFGAMAALGVALYFWLRLSQVRRNPYLSEMEESLLSSQETILVGYLLYLVALRSSKVSMYMEAAGKSTEVSSLTELKGLYSYLEVISAGMLFNLLAGFFWILVVIVAHALAWRRINPKRSSFMPELLGEYKGALQLVRPVTWRFVAPCIVAIALPPPGFVLLLVSAIVYVAIATQKFRFSVFE